MANLVLGQFSLFELQQILDRAGSWKRFKEMTGITEGELRDLLQYRKLSIRKLGGWSPDGISAELKRIGSTELFCIIHACKDSELRQVCKDFSIDVKTLTSPIGSTYGVGRKGENFFKEVRGVNIKEDCFQSIGHTSPFDFVDITYGLVNVKTAARQRFQAQTRAKDPNYWHFSTKGWRDCDHIALVPLDPKGNPMMVVMVSSKEIGDHWPTHIVLTGKTFYPSSSSITPAVKLSDEHYDGRIFTLLVSLLVNRKEGRYTQEDREAQDTLAELENEELKEDSDRTV